MKLWTQEIEQRATRFPLGSQDGKGLDSTVLVKYFNPYGNGDWIITEASPQENGDWLMFGYCHLTEWEFGYVLLSEILNTKVDVYGCQMSLERDLYIGENATVRDLAQGY